MLAIPVGIGLGLTLARGNAPTFASSNPVQSVSRAVPKRIATIPLVEQIVEVSGDPWRDVPSWLRECSKIFSVPGTLLTRSRANIAELWSWFGVFYQRVKESKPPDKPYIFDIIHSARSSCSVPLATSVLSCKAMPTSRGTSPGARQPAEQRRQCRTTPRYGELDAVRHAQGP